MNDFKKKWKDINNNKSEHSDSEQNENDSFNDNKICLLLQLVNFFNRDEMNEEEEDESNNEEENIDNEVKQEEKKCLAKIKKMKKFIYKLSNIDLCEILDLNIDKKKKY